MARAIHRTYRAASLCSSQCPIFPLTFDCAPLPISTARAGRNQSALGRCGLRAHLCPITHLGLRCACSPGVGR